MFFTTIVPEYKSLFFLLKKLLSIPLCNNLGWISDGCFKQRKWLTELSTDLLFPRGAESILHLHRHLHYTEKNIETLTVHVPGVQSSESQVLQGFIVDGVVVSEPHYRASSTDSNFKALVLLEELWWGDELRSSKLRYEVP